MTDGDPATPPAREASRPLVAGRADKRSVWLFAGVLVLLAAFLFYALEARRSALSSPAVMVPNEVGSGTIAAPPELVIPSEFGDEPFPPLVIRQPRFVEALPSNEGEPARLVRRAPPEAYFDDPVPPQPAPLYDPNAELRPVISRPQPDTSMEQPSGTDRKRLVRFDNPGTTVPKGTVIHAVLESALDSTRPGAVRAIVSRDVSSFDGSRVLIPKGSRLIGEYEADLARGQKRALIQWNRLMLPGGAIMELDSPSADPLGRAGVKGKVDSHFFARFGGAILQSILDIGVQVAARQAGGDTVILNTPDPLAGQLGGEEIRPTLKVRHGTSVSVFVAHDLDFSGAAG